MSVLTTRPIADLCDSEGRTCGTSPPWMNYDGGDCLPGLPGPLPVPGCGGYSSGAPYEGSPECPECSEYCVQDCWLVQITAAGSITYSSPILPFTHQLYNGLQIATAGHADVSSTLRLSGSLKARISYTGPPPIPDVVKVNIDSRVNVSGLYGSASGSNGLGDPLLPNPGLPQNAKTSGGSLIKKLPLDDDGVATYSVSVNGSESWFSTYAQRPYTVQATLTVQILPCADDSTVINPQ